MCLKSLFFFYLLLILTACAVSEQPSVREGRVSVYQSDGSRQCQGGGVNVSEMQHTLGGIKVYEARVGMLQDVAFTGVCGGATPNINIYVIDAKNLKQAQQRGFHVLPNQGLGGH